MKKGYLTDKQVVATYIASGSIAEACRLLGCSNKRIQGALLQLPLQEYQERKFAMLSELSHLEIVR